MSSNSPAEIRYCEHAARVIRIEAPAITELLAAMAHLDKALTADPAQTTAHFAPRDRQDLVPDWIHSNADQIRTRLEALISRYPRPEVQDPPASA
ncbi:hypothetical protein AB0D13_23325 [Streptomyces sp. NPDC048430]|uniref:hypothetical protein n=1 Tax=Streptomyces sp. NPDC048430 TaxID=3155388 RepID=UPI00343A465E